MSSFGSYNEKRQNRWYFIGLAAACTACVTHPLDLLKVLLQTQTEKPLTLRQMLVKIYNTEGILGFYKGLSASLMRQLTFTTARIGVYEHIKHHITNKSTKLQLALAIGAGICGVFIGMIAEVTNVRMQSDMRLPPEQRRNYKHVFDGLGRIIKEEGFKSLYTGITPNIIRGITMTISTNIVYDQVKFKLIQFGLKDDMGTHMMSSITAACTATTATQPIDLIKSRMISAQSKEFKSILDVFKFTAKQGPRAFYRGYLPAITRAIPHTAILHLLMEQLRLHFGRLPPIASKNQ